MLKLLQEYLRLRLDITQRVLSSAELNAATARCNALQEALWQQVKAVAAKDNAMVPTGLLVQTLNEMIDSQEKRLTALRRQLPNIVLVALYAVATVAVGFTGYASGLEARRSRFPVYITAALISGVILLIQGLDRPFIRTSQQPMIDAAASVLAFPK